MFAYDQFEGLSKDQTIYPKFTSQMAKDARDRLCARSVDLLVAGTAIIGTCSRPQQTS
jgi:hypothetical protein